MLQSPTTVHSRSLPGPVVPPHFAKAMVIFVAVKSVLLGATAALLDVAFIRALVLVVVSAAVTGTFGVVIARIQSRADERQHRRLDYLESRVNDVAGVVGASRRNSDPDGEPRAASPPPTGT